MVEEEPEPSRAQGRVPGWSGGSLRIPQGVTSEAFERFKEFKVEVEKHRGKSIKSLQSDLGGEYLLGEFRKFLKDHGITSQLAAPSQPQQNGVAERRNRTLLEMVRSMISTQVSQYPFGDTHWK